MSTVLGFRFHGRWTAAAATALLLAVTASAAPKQGRIKWVKGLGIKVIHDCTIFSRPSTKSKALRKGYEKERLTSVGHPPKGWYEVYWPSNSRGYIQSENVEKQWERDGHGRLKDAWVGYHDTVSDYYRYEIVNPQSPDEGESVPLRVAYYFDPGMNVGERDVTSMGPLAMGFVLGKLQTAAFEDLPRQVAAASHQKALGLLASYGPPARSGILYLLNSSHWVDQLHAAEAMAVVTERLAQAERSDPKAISTWCPGIGGLGEVAQPGMYYAGEAPPVRGLPPDVDNVEAMRAYIRKDPALTQKVYAALRKFYAIGRSKELVERMKALLHSKHAAVRQAATKALRPLGS